MYTRKDEAIRGVLIPVLVIGVPIGIFVLGQALGVDPNVTGLTFVAMLVGLVVWRIWVARHPERWPLPKKLFRALRAVGFRGAVDQGGQGDDVSGLDDGFIVTCSDQPSVRAIVNEKTRELSLLYRRRAGSWLRHEDAFRLAIARDEADGAVLVIQGKPSAFRFTAKTSAETRLAAWIGASLGEQMLSLPLTRITVTRKANEDPWLVLDLTVPEETFSGVARVVAGAKELFWKLMGAVEAEQSDSWLR